MRAYIFVLLFMIVASSCSQKLPMPSSDDTGIFVIPVKISNETTADFAYQYSFIYTPQTKVNIKVVPRKGMRFAFTKKFPAGKYQIEGIKTTTGMSTKVEGLSMPVTVMLSAPFSFEIMPKRISLWPGIMVIEQEWATPLETGMQGFHITAMNKAQIIKVINDIKNLPNAEFWGFAKNLGVSNDTNNIGTDYFIGVDRNLPKYQLDRNLPIYQFE